MGRYFKIINRSTMQYIEPFHMPSSERFPGILCNELVCKLVTWLVCGSTNWSYLQVRNSGFYSRKYLGAWHNHAVDIIGDYDEESLCQTVRDEYQDITTEALAMLFENDVELLDRFARKATGSSDNFRTLAEIGILEHCPPAVTFHLAGQFGARWKDRYYKVCY